MVPTSGTITSLGCQLPRAGPATEHIQTKRQGGNDVSVFTAQSLLPTLLTFPGPSQGHSTVVEDPTPSPHAQTSLWADIPPQQLPTQCLLVGCSTEGHWPRTGTGLWEGLYRMSVKDSYLCSISVHLCSPPAQSASSSCLSVVFGGGRNCS